LGRSLATVACCLAVRLLPPAAGGADVLGAAGAGAAEALPRGPAAGPAVGAAADPADGPACAARRQSSSSGNHSMLRTWR
jgi:hypothetical protein